MSLAHESIAEWFLAIREAFQPFVYDFGHWWMTLSFPPEPPLNKDGEGPWEDRCRIDSQDVEVDGCSHMRWKCIYKRPGSGVCGILRTKSLGDRCPTWYPPMPPLPFR